jgi:hypothetical protein
MTTQAPGRRAGRAGAGDRGLDGDERAVYRAAAEHALREYPGALGELVHRELQAFADFGYRLAGDRLVARLAAELLSAVQEGEAPGTRWGADR